MTTFIPEFRVATLTAAIEKLNKRARRLNLPEITIRLTGNRDLRNFTQITEGSETVFTSVVEAVEVEVDGTSPVLADWQFVATIDRIENSNVFNASPVFKGQIPHRFRECSHNCEHCRVNRVRNNTFVLNNIKTGEFKQVGRTCLKDFLGHASVASITDAASIFASLTEMYTEASEFSGCGGGTWSEMYDLKVILAWTVNVIREYGWVSRATAEESYRVSTRDHVVELVTNKPKSKEVALKLEALRATTEANLAEAEACLAWVRTLGTDNENDYLANLAAVCSLDMVSKKRLGLAVSAVAAYQRHVEQERQKAYDLTHPRTNEFFGTVGERVTRTLTPVAMRQIQTDFGMSTLVMLEDTDRRTFKWFASNCPLSESQIGTPVNLTFYIKDHAEYKGVNQTAITRARIAVPKVAKPRKARAEAAVITQ